MDINRTLKTLVEELTEQILSNLADDINQQVKQNVASKLAQISIHDEVRNHVERYLSDKITGITFPESSIPGTAIDKQTLKLTGANIRGGIIEQFGSTGIDDRATDCRVTVLDEHTVVENNLLTQSLTVKTSAVVEGDLIVKGEIPTDSPAFKKLVEYSQQQVKQNLNTELFSSYSDIIFAKIKEEGIDVDKLRIKGVNIVEGRVLAPGIMESNLQKVGQLRELQVTGETLLDGTVYVSNKRVGVNTIEPGSALSVWDEEVEVGLGKRQKDVAVIGTPRNQTLIVSSNNKDNLSVNTDGTVTINSLNIGSMNFSSAEIAPSYEAPKGTVVFNANPNLGGPLGWVSLGNARWANFGIID